MTRSSIASRRARTGLATLVFAALVISIPALTGLAAVYEVTIPVSTVVRAPAGSVTSLGQIDVPDELVGETCTVRSESRNQHSVHPGNHLVISSGSSSVRLEDVEAEPGAVVKGDSELELGTTAELTLEMGPDAVFSAGIEITVTCPDVSPTTETTEPGSTTEPEVSTTPPDTTEPTDVSTSSTTPVQTTSPGESSTSTPSTIPPEVLPTSITAAPTTPPVEVEPTGELPFTGASPGVPALAALSLIGIGLVALVATRAIKDR